jgi:hypothetical protein
VANWVGELTIKNSTISGNSAPTGGGVFGYYSNTIISNCTISGNSASSVGGGITIEDPKGTSLGHSLIAGNSAPTGSEIYGVGISADFNLIGDSSKTTAQALSGVTPGATDILATSNGTNPTALAAILSPLANNGGPTKTHALVAGSPAIEAGDPNVASPPDFDQRGAPFGRVSGGQIDIGAFELQSIGTITVNTLTDELDGSIADGDVSLRDAIAAAPVGETINFSVTGAINLTLGQLTIGRNLTVTGPGANQLKIDAGGASRVLEITAGTVGLSGLTLTGGDSGIGGGVFNRGNATLTGVAIEGNTAEHFGGGASNAGTLTIADSTISGNSASWGGGVNNDGSLTIKNSTISGNSASWGGGVSNNINYTYYTSMTISNCTISGNSAANLGGGIVILQESSAWLSHTLIAGNSAPQGSEIFSVIGLGGEVHLNAFNLIGDSSKTTAQAHYGFPAGATDILATSNGTKPTALAAILGPLANNGGPTMTHALLAGSPAINAGDPGAMAGMGDVPMHDQRGAPFGRVSGGRIDVGAVERQPIPPAVFGDYNHDGTVDAGDYVVWRKTLGSNVANFSGADGSGNGVVDQTDHAIWRAHFGQTAASGAHVASVFTAASTPESSVLGEEGHEETSQRLRASSLLEAVERRGVSEEQQTAAKREPAFAELVAPSATILPEKSRTARSSLETKAAHGAYRRDEALLLWLSQPDSKHAVNDWANGNVLEVKEADNADADFFYSIDEVFALLTRP